MSDSGEFAPSYSSLSTDVGQRQRSDRGKGSKHEAGSAFSVTFRKTKLDFSRATPGSRASCSL